MYCPYPFADCSRWNPQRHCRSHPSVTARVVVDVPFAVTEPGDATMADLLADGAPATNDTDVDS